MKTLRRIGAWMLMAIVMIVCSMSLSAQTESGRGKYFHKKEYVPVKLPCYDSVKHILPSPILDEHPEWVRLYWKAWEIAFSNLQTPPEGSPLVSNWIDEGLTPQIFQWDTHFMAMLGRYAFSVFPFIESHDNFYARQHDDGMICRVINEADGADHVWGLGENYARTINPPLFSWAEMEYYKFTHDKKRLEHVLEPIERYVAWVERHRKAHGTVHGLYWSNGQASGMDNTPRDSGRKGPNGDIHSATDAMGWVDMSAQIKMCYDNLANMCRILGYKDKVRMYEQRAEQIAARINQFMWNDEDGLYHDVDVQGVQTPWITVATFWPVLAGVATDKQVERLVQAVKNKELFWRQMPLPSLAANQSFYDKCGSYWQGGVWAPTSYMTVKGLEYRGYSELARAIAEKQLRAVWKVYEATGTIWEVYAPDIFMPATTAVHTELCRPNFVGWSGLMPISMLIENVLGFSVLEDAKGVSWTVSRRSRHGIENLRFGRIVASLLCKGDSVCVVSNGSFTLWLNGVKCEIRKGKQYFEVPR